MIAESQNLNTTSGMRRGSLRWLAPEYMLPESPDQSYITARDSYAYGCTVIEVGPTVRFSNLHILISFYPEVFTGKPPYSDIKHEACVIADVLKGSLPQRPPPDIFPHSELWSLVTECLRTLPSKRPDARAIVSRVALLASQPDLNNPSSTTLGMTST